MRRLGLLLLLLPLALPAGAGELQRNPFAAPDLRAAPRTAARTRPAAAPQRPGLVLRSTLVSETESLANINGRILRPGETIDGCRLLRVGEFEAVLMVNGKEMTITLERRE